MIFCRGSYRLCNWLSLRCLVTWFSNLPMNMIHFRWPYIRIWNSAMVFILSVYADVILTLISGISLRLPRGFQMFSLSNIIVWLKDNAKLVPGTGLNIKMVSSKFWNHYDKYIVATIVVISFWSQEKWIAKWFLRANEANDLHNYLQQITQCGNHGLNEWFIGLRPRSAIFSAMFNYGFK